MSKLFIKHFSTGFTLFSLAIALGWFCCYAGIKWNPAEFAGSFWFVLQSLAHDWGPMFIPTAAIIFVIKQMQKNICYDVTKELRPELSRMITTSMSVSLSENIERKLNQKIGLAIKSVYHGLSRYRGFSQKLTSKMQHESLRDFHNYSISI